MVFMAFVEEKLNSTTATCEAAYASVSWIDQVAGGQVLHVVLQVVSLIPRRELSTVGCCRRSKALRSTESVTTEPAAAAVRQAALRRAGIARNRTDFLEWSAVERFLT